MAKGPKLLNPADKARKEARKKELKKNKKQRQQVRSAVIESRDPEQILAELEQLDRHEYDPENLKKEQKQQQETQVTVSSAAVSTTDLLYTEKRKKLKELFARCLAYYEKEDPDRHTKLKKLETDYESKHKGIKKEFEAVKAATEVSIDDVFLPPEPTNEGQEDDAVQEDEIADDDPLMSETLYITPLSEDGIKPPGCPSGPPPDLKQLVDSLRAHVLRPAAAPHMLLLPPHLLGRHNRNQAASDNRKRPRGPNPNHRGVAGGGRFGSNQEQPGRKRVHLQTNDSRQQQSTKQPGPSTASSSSSSVSKSAVIESKPVIFMPKATKFLPASVRSKVQPKQQTLADDKNDTSTS